MVVGTVQSRPTCQRATRRARGDRVLVGRSALIAARSPSHSPDPASSRMRPARARRTKSVRARCMAPEYVRSPLERTASLMRCSSSTRFVRFMCSIICVTGRAVNRVKTSVVGFPVPAAFSASGCLPSAAARSEYRIDTVMARRGGFRRRETVWPLTRERVAVWRASCLRKRGDVLLPGPRIVRTVIGLLHIPR